MSVSASWAGPLKSELEDAGSWLHSKRSQLQMALQRVFQMAAGCDDADFVRI